MAIKLKPGAKFVLIFGTVGLLGWSALHFGIMDRYLTPKATVAASVPTHGSEMKAFTGQAGFQHGGAGAAITDTKVAPAGNDYTAKLLTIPWNATTGLAYANGGAKTAPGSLMAKGGVKLHIERQDDYSKMQADLVKFASAVAKGDNRPNEGAAFAIIMGDGYGPFVAGTQEALAKVAPGQQLEVIGAVGFSRGEDKCMIAKDATPEGSMIAGVLGDGDINICIHYAADNNIPVNADQKTYDPRAMNFVHVSSFSEGDIKFITGAVETRTNVVTGKSERIKVNGSATWTPGDVNVAKKLNGKVRTLASTKDNRDGTSAQYMWQMPSVVIGNRQWMANNEAFVKNMLAAAFKGGELVRSNDTELLKGAAIQAEIYKEENAAYWAKYFKGVTEDGIFLGGSTTNNLGDNIALFGLNGNDNLYKRIYTVFSNVTIKYFPDFLKEALPYESVVNTKYLQALAAATADMSQLTAALPTYVANAPSQGTFAKKAVSIEFETGKAEFTSKAVIQLNDVLDNLSVSGNSIQINGHTDSIGNSAANQLLSKKRADAVKTWLMQNGGAAFPDARIRTRGFGDSQPVADNATKAGQAQNRRVEIVLLSTNN